MFYFNYLFWMDKSDQYNFIILSISASSFFIFSSLYECECEIEFSDEIHKTHTKHRNHLSNRMDKWRMTAYLSIFFFHRGPHPHTCVCVCAHVLLNDQIVVRFLKNAPSADRNKMKKLKLAMQTRRIPFDSENFVCVFFFFFFFSFFCCRLLSSSPKSRQQQHDVW